MSVNKHAVVKEWVESYLSNAKIGFEYIDAYQGFRSVIPNYGDYVVKTDIVGNKTKWYTFGFVAVESLDIYSGDNNATIRDSIDAFNDWLETQEKNKNYPDFGTNVTKYKISPLYNTADMSQVFEDKGLAKYVLMVRIEYVEKE